MSPLIRSASRIRPKRTDQRSSSELLEADHSHSQACAKPDLNGKSIRGAEDSRWDVITSAIEGRGDAHLGSHTLGYALSLDEMPAHDHFGKTANDGAHEHDSSGQAANDDGGQSGDRFFAMVSGSSGGQRSWFLLSSPSAASLGNGQTGSENYRRNS